MFPKTAYPDALQVLLQRAAEGSPIPLWQAGPLTAALAAMPGPLMLPEELSLPLPPEERLRGETARGEPGLVYLLCALLARLLSGTKLPELTGTVDRRAALRVLSADAWPAPEGADSLLRLLDRGLRLEPARRYPDRAAFRIALKETEDAANAWAREYLCLRGAAGVFSDRVLTLEFPDILGRQPGTCRILFPPDTPGVSRRHCRLDLVWGTVTVTDLSSRYGTAVDDVPLSPEKPAALLPGHTLSLAGGTQVFLLTHQ